MPASPVDELKFRDPARARALAEALEREVEDVPMLPVLGPVIAELGYTVET